MAIGTPGSRPAAGSHWRAFSDTSSLLLRPYMWPPCLSRAQTLLWRFSHCLFFFMPIQGGEVGTGQVTSPLGKGQASWCQHGLGCPSALRTFPNHPNASVHCQPAMTCPCSSSEQRGTGEGFSLKPEVNDALLDNFQLPVLAVKGISSRWHAYLCTGREAHQPASPAGPH